jgi:peptidoglycan/xylan/chitin deacetylase (PgdA/CDA1 family)
MKYLRLTITKTAFITALAGGLLVLTAYTFVSKSAVYGSTPFFSATRLFAEEQIIQGLFAVRHYSTQMLGAAAVPLLRGGRAEASQGIARALPVLTYHRIAVTDDSANVTIRNFMDQMQTLYENGWRTITLKEYEAFMRGEINLPEKSFLITFDDGAQRSFYPTDPVFETLGFSAVQYIIAAASEADGSSYYLSDEQIDHMLSRGRWEIGSHSLDAHRPYQTDAQGGTGIFYSDKLWLPELQRLETNEEFTLRVRNDLAESKRLLETRYGVPVTTIAFPFGGEAGIAGAKNFIDGERITIEEASKIYDIGWTQGERKEYTFVYPGHAGFMHERIHVDFDWDGERLLQVLENGLPKDLPFEDTMEEDAGWLSSWGQVRAGGRLVLNSNSNENSASSILDGTLLWRTYAVEARADWSKGYAFLLGSAVDERTYRACAFAQGEVQIQDTSGGETAVLAKVEAPVAYGSGVRLGMQIEDDTIRCLYDGVEIAAATGVVAREGGVGVQTWDPVGEAELIITDYRVVER